MNNAIKPNFIDRLVGIFSPRTMVERMQVRATLQDGIPTRLGERWGASTSYQFGTSSEYMHRASMRDRGRNAYNNDPVARTLIDTETDNVVGDGFNLVAQTDSQEFNDEAQERWYEWLERADIRGMLTGCELQRMLWKRSRIDGDIGCVLVTQGDESRLQVVPGDLIQSPMGLGAMQKQPNGRYIVDGIEMTAQGRPIQFYVKTEDGLGKSTYTPVAERDFRYMAHLREPNQVRGETAFATIFDPLAELKRYRESVATAAWMATVFGLIFKEPTATKQLAGLPTLTNSQGQPQRALTLENGSVKYLAPEGEVVQVDAKQPLQQTPEFIRTMLRMIGMPFHMPLELIAKDMSTCNFASARIGLLGYYRQCRAWQAWFVERFLSPVFRWWISREVKLGRMTTPAPERFFPHAFRANSWSYTDPVAEAQGDFIELDMKTKSPQMVIAERGRDADKIISDWKEWNERTKGLAMLHSTLSRDPQPQESAATAPQVPGQGDNSDGDGEDGSDDAEETMDGAAATRGVAAEGVAGAGAAQD